MIPFDELAVGSHRLACPLCARKPSEKNLGVTVEPDGGAVAHCFKCQYVESRRPRRTFRPRLPKAPIRAAQAPKLETLSDYGLEMWRASRPVHGAARSYLESRLCVLPPEDGDLRCHPALKHPSGYIGPALVALISNTENGQQMSLHRTWVKPDGTKADVEPPRMLLGGHRKAGGVIRLWPDDSITHGLALAEGVETALSLAHGYTPVWSCIDAGNMAAFPVLPGIEALSVAVDHDPAGVKAANQCAERWHAAGREVRLVMPPRAGVDLNDIALEAA